MTRSAPVRSAETWLRVKQWRRRAWVCAGLAGLAVVLVEAGTHPALQSGRRWEGRPLRLVAVGPTLQLGLTDPGRTGSTLNVHPAGLLPLTGSEPEAQAFIQRACGSGMVLVHFQPSGDAGSAPSGYIYLADGRLLNAQLLRAGLASCDKGRGHETRNWFGRLEAQSRR